MQVLRASLEEVCLSPGLRHRCNIVACIFSLKNVLYIDKLIINPAQVMRIHTLLPVSSDPLLSTRLNFNTLLTR